MNPPSTMKISHIIGIIVIAIAIGVIASTAGDASVYTTFTKAEVMAQDGDHKMIHVVGKLKKDAQGQIYGYDSIEDFTIDEDGYGGFTVLYTVNIYSGCRDLNKDLDDESMYVEMEVDFEDGSVLLTGEELAPQRDPDEF